MTYTLRGPVEMNHHEIAAAMSETLGFPVRYEPIDTDAYAEVLRAQGRPEHLIQHLAAVALDYQRRDLQRHRRHHRTGSPASHPRPSSSTSAANRTFFPNR